MIGVLVGAAAIAGFIMVRRHHRYHRHAMAGCGDGWHGGWHGHARHGSHWHGHGHWGGGGGWRSYARRAIEYRLLEELDCSPAQERLIRTEIRTIAEQLRGVRDEREATREDLARAVAGPQLDREALKAMFTRHDERLVELRANVTASLERVHAALDDRQRERLAELVRDGLRGHGRRRWGAGGPYR